MATTPGDSGATYIISAPGLYYLDGDMTGEDSKNGISVTSDGVTIDLRGHRMEGVATSGRGIYGGNSTRLTVRDGAVDSWPSGGIQAGDRSRVQNVALDLNGSFALVVSYQSTVRDCQVSGGSVSLVGISMGSSSFIENCVVTGCTSAGIGLTGSTIVRKCVSSSNGGSGFSQGSGSASIIEECTARNNTAEGISVCFGNILRNNVCESNTGAGIELRCGQNRVAGNHLTRNGTGVAAFSNGSEQVFGNTFVDNTTSWSGATGNNFGPPQSAATATSPFANLLGS